MKVLLPRRVTERHVGGNTTYARMLRALLPAAGFEVGSFGSAAGGLKSLASETAAARTREPGSILHFTADSGPLVSPRMPSVVTVHGVASRHIGVARGSVQERVWRARVAAAIRSTDELVTVSHAAARDISDVFDVDPGRITVIHHGISHGVFAGDVPLSSELEGRVTGPYVLYLGNVEPRKNLVALVRAFERRELKDLGVGLVIAGRRAWRYASTMEEISRSPNTTYIDFVSDSDRTALMRGASLFAFPSLYEGFGLPVLEALAAGTPVACTRNGSLAEVAGPAWEIVGDTESDLARDIAAALQDDVWRSEITETGPAWARRFTWEESIRRHAEVYSRLEAR